MNTNDERAKLADECHRLATALENVTAQCACSDATLEDRTDAREALHAAIDRLAAQPALTGSPLRADYVKAARIFAKAYGLHPDAPAYLPRSEEEADRFEPDAWVIAAMMQAYADGQWDAPAAQSALGGDEGQGLAHWKAVAHANKSRADDYDRLAHRYILAKAEIRRLGGDDNFVNWQRTRETKPEVPAQPAQARVPLTDEELDALALDEDGLPDSHLEFGRAIERAHGIEVSTTTDKPSIGAGCGAFRSDSTTSSEGSEHD